MTNWYFMAFINQHTRPGAIRSLNLQDRCSQRLVWATFLPEDVLPWVKNIDSRGDEHVLQFMGRCVEKKLKQHQFFFG